MIPGPIREDPDASRLSPCAENRRLPYDHATENIVSRDHFVERADQQAHLRMILQIEQPQTSCSFAAAWHRPENILVLPPIEIDRRLPG
jgi:hypothetical protein